MKYKINHVCSFRAKGKYVKGMGRYAWENIGRRYPFSFFEMITLDEYNKRIRLMMLIEKSNAVWLRYRNRGRKNHRKYVSQAARDRANKWRLEHPREHNEANKQWAKDNPEYILFRRVIREYDPLHKIQMRFNYHRRKEVKQGRSYNAD